MSPYAANATWLARFAPFRTLTMSAAYLTPFFLEKGLSLSEIFMLQAIFSVACVIWEIPSGLLADKFGRARCIKLSAPIAAVAMVTYGFSDSYAMFLACEIGLAVASGLYTGADMALLYDSIRADRTLSDAAVERQYQAQRRRIKSLMFGASFAAFPISIALAYGIGISATIVADGLILAAGTYYVYKLKEAPYERHAQQPGANMWRQFRDSCHEVWRVLAAFARNREARWLVALGTVLSTSTYLAAWSSAPYYASLGLPLASFGAIFALRALCKSALSFRYNDAPVDRPRWWKTMLRKRILPRQPTERSMWAYCGLSGVTYLPMAAGSGWLMPSVVGHDVVHALHDDPINVRLNGHMSQYRAMLNSVSHMIHRLAYAVGSILCSLLSSHVSLRASLAITGLACGLLASIAMWQLQRLGTFRERR